MIDNDLTDAERLALFRELAVKLDRFLDVMRGRCTDLTSAIKMGAQGNIILTAIALDMRGGWWQKPASPATAEELVPLRVASPLIDQTLLTFRGGVL